MQRKLETKVLKDNMNLWFSMQQVRFKMVVLKNCLWIEERKGWKNRELPQNERKLRL